MRAKQCDECEYQTDKNLCEKGHRPRFYMPKNITSTGCDSWGYKRRCSDFELKNADYEITAKSKPQPPEANENDNVH